ncbi:MAG: hypothetical protein JXA04_03075 [Gammaproteobacteria bacterium]|nr:hypothetical protein [Gammaproteobacteria bacterium]
MQKITVILIFGFILLLGCTNQGDTNDALTTQSKELDKELVESWGDQKEFFVNSDFEIISWDEAKKLLLGNTVKGGNQYRTDWLTIYTTDDKKYLVKQPEVDALWKFAGERDFDVIGFEAE